jgi:hypothetical protein
VANDEDEQTGIRTFVTLATLVSLVAGDTLAAEGGSAANTNH